jgi:Flp pilus assembly protein TadD
VRRALELDDTLPEAHASLGLVSFYDYDWNTAEGELRRAIELNPRDATTHQWYANVLAYKGRLAQARVEIDRARYLDPTSPIINTNSAQVHDWSRNYPAAIEDARRTLELDPEFSTAVWFMTIAYAQMGRYPDALALLESFTAEDSLFLAFRGYLLAISGRREAARAVLAEIMDRSKREYVSPSSVALIDTGLGDHDAAFAWLDQAVEERDCQLRFLKMAPYWDSLRADPRFAQLLRRVHLD